MNQLSHTATDAFQAAFAGMLVFPEDPQYNEVRQIWNGMIDRRPSLIARCGSADDVVRSLDFVRQHDLPFSIRGGGHNIAGNAVCDGGLMIDLSLMKDISIDPELRRGYVEPG
ncbi:FAD-binding oxidoreductase [Stutzerimonas xanthomarina]|uniref:FAD-binding oxidoreductase n=1 Tax=Stutzerimonas xanthomarina TaxID=271420 RepID=UPI003AA869A2